MGEALKGVSREDVEQIVSQLAIVKENLRQAIQQRPGDGGRAQLWLKPSSRKSSPSATKRRKRERRRAPAPQSNALDRLKTKLPASRRQRMRWMLFGLLPIVLIAGGLWYVARRRGSCPPMTPMWMPRRSAYRPTSPASCKTVNVKDNQHVDAGQVLYRLDPRQFQIALDNAKANLAQTALIDRCDEAGLQTHAQRRRCGAGAGRSRSDQLQSPGHAAEKRHRVPGRVRPGKIRAGKRQEQAPILAAAGASATRQTRRQCRHSDRSASAISASAGAGRRGATAAQ